jgi:hypothetical protein
MPIHIKIIHLSIPYTLEIKFYEEFQARLMIEKDLLLPLLLPEK